MEAYRTAAAEAGLRLNEVSFPPDRRLSAFHAAVAATRADPTLIICTRDPNIWTAILEGQADMEYTSQLLQDPNLPHLAWMRFAYMEQDEDDVYTCFYRASVRCSKISDPIDNFKRVLGCEARNGKRVECVVCLCELGEDMHLCTRCAKALCKADAQRLRAFAAAEGAALRCPHCRFVWAEA
jgi:hypothetical protein